jgi:hypothetical protein
MTMLIDKFGIISNVLFNSDIKKRCYIENYLNNNYICHHDLIKNQNISIEDINIILKNYLRKYKNQCVSLIRLGKLNIDNIINFINETKIKFNFIRSICNNEFPDDNKLILEIILSNSCCDKLISSYINDRKSIKNFITHFDKFNIYQNGKQNDDNKKELNNKISNFIIDSLPIILVSDDNNILQNDKLYILWVLDISINYYLMMIKKYNYLSVQVFDDIINIIEKNISICIIKNRVNFLKYFQINFKKFNIILELIDEPKNKKKIQDSLLFFKPTNFIELYDFINILISMNITNKDTIICNFIEINKKIITKENIKFISNKINVNIINNILNVINYKFIKYLTFNQDLIIANTTMLLMKRYIYFENFDKLYENKEYEIMKNILPKNILYKYMKVINDINYNINYNFHNMIPIFITKSIWNFDYIKGYKRIYYDNTNVQLFLHLGEVITEFKTDKGVYNIRMLPIHYEIICKPTLNKATLSHYKREYIDSIFKQLFENEILELSNDYDEELFKVNKNYDRGDLDLIKLSNENLHINNTIDDVIYKEVKLERKEIIMANINSILKQKNENMQVAEIFINIKEKLNRYFDIEQDYYYSVLEEMSNKDYIDIDYNTNNIKKLIY